MTQPMERAVQTQSEMQAETFTVGNRGTTYRYDAEELLDFPTHPHGEIPAELAKCHRLRRLSFGNHYIGKLQHLPDSLEQLSFFLWQDSRLKKSSSWLAGSYN